MMRGSPHIVYVLGVVLIDDPIADLSVSDAIALSSLIITIPSAIATIIGAIISYHSFKQLRDSSKYIKCVHIRFGDEQILSDVAEGMIPLYFRSTSFQRVEHSPTQPAPTCETSTLGHQGQI